MYPETCNVIGLKHYLHLPLEKSLLEKWISILRIEQSFDDYYLCMQQKDDKCNLFHVYNWLQFFVSMYNDIKANNKNNNNYDFELKQVRILSY